MFSCPSNTKPWKKQTENKYKTEDKRQKPNNSIPWAPPNWPFSQITILPNNHSPTPAMRGGNHTPISELGSHLCCRFQLFWLPVNNSCNGYTQSCWIVIGIVLENIFNIAVLAVYCIKGTAPSSWRISYSHMQPLGPNDGFCCRCWGQNWRCFCAAWMTNTWHTKQTIDIYQLITSVHNLLYGGRYVHTYAMVCLHQYGNWRHFPMQMLTSTRQTKWNCSSLFPI